ncbi:MAG: SulP family inorganic anion transporter [Pseudomonadota bacterium]
MTDPSRPRRAATVPVLQGILPVDWPRVPTDVLAGLTFASLAIPEVMGYTKIAGTPVITGLYTLLIPMALFAILGSSRHLSVGADSATAAITASALAGMAVSGSAEYLALASLLALMAGVLLIAARGVGLGFLSDFLSRTVLVGFLTGVGIQVASGEIPGLFGIETNAHGTFAKLASGFANIGHLSWSTFAISVAVLVVVVGARRLSARLPGPLFAVIGVIVLSWGFDFEGQGIAVLGDVPGGLPGIALPDIAWSWGLVKDLLPTAVAIFVVILAQSAATARAFAGRYDDTVNENADLLGLGFANLGAALSGTFVVNGSPTKTEMVADAGGRSQIAQLSTVAVVVLVLLFLTGPLAFLPDAVLSAIVFLIGLKLIDLRGLREIYRQARTEFWIALATAAVVVGVGVEQGIIFAMLLSLLDHTRKGYRPKTSVLVRDEQGDWRSRPTQQASPIVPGLIIYRFPHGMYYANAYRLAEDVASLLRQSPPGLRRLCVEMSAVDDIDYTAAYVLRATIRDLKAKGIDMVFLFAEPAIQKELRRYGVLDLVPPDPFFASGQEVIGAFLDTERSS